jgi:hypothetical protein
LTVVDQIRAEATEIGDVITDGSADDVRPQCLDRGDHHVVAAADGQAQRVPLGHACVRAQDRVRRRVVRIWVHRVRTVTRERGGKAHVEAVKRDDPRAARSVFGSMWPARTR